MQFLNRFSKNSIFCSARRLAAVVFAASSVFAAGVAVAAAQESAASAAAKPTAISGTLASLGVFKNGIVVVEEKFDVPGPGKYSVAAPPNPLHGTFFVASDASVSTSATTADVDVPLAEAESIDWTTDFRGRAVRVLLPGEKEPRTVRIVSLARPEDRADRRGAAAYSSFDPIARQGVLLQTDAGETIWLNAAGLAQLSVVSLAEGETLETVVRREPRLIFDVAPNADGAVRGASIRLFYLTRGATWAPQYRVALKDAATLEIEQTAIFANELRSFENVPTAFFSGFPQISMQNVPSPMAPDVDLAAFFSALTNPENGVASYRRDSFAMKQAMVSNAAVGYSRSEIGGGDFGAASGESAAFSDGVDVFAQDVGRQTLAKNERKTFSVAKKDASYRRVVCWNISDARDANGRFVDPANPSTDRPSGLYGRTTSGEVALDSSNRFEEPWDALQFQNPFDFPITTGPATVLSGAKFLGQNALYWTNPNEEVLLPITKALSVRVRSIENERQFDEKELANVAPTNLESGAARLSFFEAKLAPKYWGQTILIRGSYFRVAVIDATITLDNRRNETTPVLLSRQYSGVALPDSFEGFDETPKIATLGDAGDANFYRAFNPRNELRWTTTLQPNEKRTLKFSYQTLIAQ